MEPSTGTPLPPTSEKPALTDALIASILASEASARANRGDVPESGPSPSQSLTEDIRDLWAKTEERLLKECHINTGLYRKPTGHAFEKNTGLSQRHDVLFYGDEANSRGRKGLYLAEGTTAQHWSQWHTAELTANSHCLRVLEKQIGLQDIQEQLRLAKLESEKTLGEAKGE